jgi:hypothetical protein
VDSPNLNVHTFSGAIDLRLTEGARGRVSFNTFSGDLTSDLPITLHKQSRRTWSVKSTAAAETS